MKIFKKRSGQEKKKEKEKFKEIPTVRVSPAGPGSTEQGEKPLWPQQQRATFQTTCAQCGNPCEVPFRPTEGRKIYCQACFRNIKNQERMKRENTRFQQRNFGGQKNLNRPEFDGGRPAGGNETVRQLQIMNAKIDRLVRAMEMMTNLNQRPAAAAQKEPAVQAASATKAKKPAKQAAKKRKK